MSSRRELAQEYAQRVVQWIAERDRRGDHAEYERDGRINRGALCAELDFGRSVLTQNPAVKAALAEAEARWFERRQVDIEAHEAARERAEKRVAERSADVSKLEDELARLKAENALLRRQLERYEAMDEVIRQTGMAPRL
ncbi:MAG: hypothetical protein WCG22_05545 [Lentisphaerota bacterium]